MAGSRSQPSPMARVHGGPNATELQRLGLDRNDVLDLSVNINPYGPSPSMVRALAHVKLGVYPEPDALQVRAELAASCGVATDGLVLGNGASDLMWTLALWLKRTLPRGQGLMMVEPTFSELHVAAEALGLDVAEHRLQAVDMFDLNFDRLGESLACCKAGAVYLCAPSSPLGRAVAGPDLRAFADAHPNVLVLVDQSFLSLSERYQDAVMEWPANVVLIRSLTKDHGIPGVRIGYLLAEAEIALAVRSLRPTWAVGAHTQAAASYAASIEGRAFVQSSRKQLLCDSRALMTGLIELGLKPVPSSTCYVTVEVANAALVRMRLLEEYRILVRDCTSFGLPSHIRIAARPPEQRAILLAALGAVGQLKS